MMQGITHFEWRYVKPFWMQSSDDENLTKEYVITDNPSDAVMTTVYARKDTGAAYAIADFYGGEFGADMATNAQLFCDLKNRQLETLNVIKKQPGGTS